MKRLLNALYWACAAVDIWIIGSYAAMVAWGLFAGNEPPLWHANFMYLLMKIGGVAPL